MRNLPVSFALVLFSFAALGADLAAPSDIHRIQSRGTLIVTMYEKDMPPFFMRDRAGHWFGFDVELAQGIAQKLGVGLKLETDAVSFDEVIDRVANRKADLGISKLSKTLARAARVRFTDTYATMHQVLVVNRVAEARFKAGEDPWRLLDREGVKVGVPIASAYVDYARRDFSQATMKPVTDRYALLAEVAKGETTAALLPEDTVEDWLYKNPTGGLRVRAVTRPDREDAYGIAVHGSDTHLVSWLNTYLELGRADGTMDRLEATYIRDHGWRKRQ